MYRKIDEYPDLDDDRNRGFCWHCNCDRPIAVVDRSAEVGVHAVDKVCSQCGEDVKETK